jgi:hypothetical protein
MYRTNDNDVTQLLLSQGCRRDPTPTVDRPPASRVE